MASEQGFEIDLLYVAWVPPSKEAEGEVKINSKILPHANKAYEYLLKIFDKSHQDCKIPIQFRSDDKQDNEVRKELLNIVEAKEPKTKKVHADVLSERLARVTDDRNGIGLFVIIEGTKLKMKRLVLIRFKADEALYTKHDGKGLEVEFINEVFTKKSTYFKSAYYEDMVSKKSFWKGFAVDKQIVSNPTKDLSDYWIIHFLNSQTSINNVQGTTHFARVMRDLLKKSDNIDEKQQLINAIVALKYKTEKPLSIKSFCDSYLSSEVTSKIQEVIKDHYYMDAVFSIDQETYNRELGSTVMALKSGITIAAPTFEFDSYVKQEAIDNVRMRFTVEGEVADKKISRMTKVGNEN